MTDQETRDKDELISLAEAARRYGLTTQVGLPHPEENVI